MRPFFMAFAGRIFAAFVLAVCVFLGFGPSEWVSTMTAWFADPLRLSLDIVRVSAVLLGMGALVVLMWDRLREVLSGKKLVLQFLDIKTDPATLFGLGGVRLANKAIYIHVNVSSAGRTSFEACSGRIFLIERLDVNDNPIATLQGTRELIWAPRELERTVLPLHMGGPQDLDIFRTLEVSNKLELLCIGYPQSWADFFEAPGTYRLSVNVSGDGISKSIRLRLIWRGKWDDFDIDAR